jgi:hypothetical protein
MGITMFFHVLAMIDRSYYHIHIQRTKRHAMQVVQSTPREVPMS